MTNSHEFNQTPLDIPGRVDDIFIHTQQLLPRFQKEKYSTVDLAILKDEKGFPELVTGTAILDSFRPGQTLTALRIHEQEGIFTLDVTEPIQFDASFISTENQASWGNEGAISFLSRLRERNTQFINSEVDGTITILDTPLSGLPKTTDLNLDKTRLSVIENAEQALQDLDTIIRIKDAGGATEIPISLGQTAMIIPFILDERPEKSPMHPANRSEQELLRQQANNN